ncbi:hypothetical protein [Natronolimnohabitans innermongolicus]|uniref:Uncharacterized protein n=1 Tax=Natronolimnohabitans innermongolicus JCM 12255 TaxID=1227499 RepID=L9WNF9_9EURY|nr:hypothetical protein [Natronolimnohabitans innermongolicus]ELY51000.1 hypothetical protein C493_18491 [Natronolimnohabitans innermongolicus JCM 12255]
MSNPFDDLKEDGLEEDPEATESADDDGEAEPELEPTPVDADENASDAEPEPTTAPGPDSDLEPETAGSPSDSDSSSIDEEPDARPDERDVASGESDPAESGPAFEYSDVQQKPFYAREETVNQFENAIRTTIVPNLAEASVLDEETREIHDAVLRLANEEPERIAELVLEERRQSGKQ